MEEQLTELRKAELAESARRWKEELGIDTGTGIPLKGDVATPEFQRALKEKTTISELFWLRGKQSPDARRAYNRSYYARKHPGCKPKASR